MRKGAPANFAKPESIHQRDAPFLARGDDDSKASQKELAFLFNSLGVSIHRLARRGTGVALRGTGSVPRNPRL